MQIKNKPASKKISVVSRKARHCLVIPNDTSSRAKALMGLDRRSFCNLIEVLVDAEYERRKPELEAKDA